MRAAEREFATAGFAGATAKSIAARAKVATGTFYQYFADKNELLRELAVKRLAYVANRSVGMLEAEPVDNRRPLQDAEVQMRAVVQMVLDYHRENPELHAVLTERRHVDKQLEELTARAERALVTRIASLLAAWRFDGDVEATAFVLFGMVEGGVHAHVLGESVVSDERFLAAIVDALLRVTFATNLKINPQ